MEGKHTCQSKGLGTRLQILIGMGDLSIVPIDTHVLNFAKRYSLTEKTYRYIQELCKERFGKYAGIAQLYIFKEMVDLRISGMRRV